MACALIHFVTGLLLRAFQVGFGAQAAPLLVHLAGGLPALGGGASLAAAVGTAALGELLVEILALELAFLAQHAAPVEALLVVGHGRSSSGERGRPRGTIQAAGVRA